MAHRLSLLPLLALTAALTGCSIHETRQLDRAAATSHHAEPIVGVSMSNGQEAIFDSPGATLRGDTLVAQIRGTPFSVGLDQVTRVWVTRRKPSWIASLGGLGFAVGMALVVVGLGFAAQSS